MTNNRNEQAEFTRLWERGVLALSYYGSIPVWEADGLLRRVRAEMAQAKRR